MERREARGAKRRNLPVTRAEPALESSRTSRVSRYRSLRRGGEGGRDEGKERIYKRRMDSNDRDRTTAAVGQKTMRHKSRTAAGRRGDRSIHSDTRSMN